MEQRSITKPKNILYIAIALGIGTLICIKLYKTFEEIKLHKNKVRDRIGMDLFYENKIEYFYLLGKEHPDITYDNLQVPINEWKSRMLSDGYKYYEIDKIAQSARENASIRYKEKKQFHQTCDALVTYLEKLDNEE
ncbi:MAG: hypothetical protein WC747_01575 [Candidatus Babeliales bacterium]|jgi:hypothetical protein